ncbi:hypothetical protein Q8A73_022683 [Channa argus]|nr:hypothetical protein Q8A73_022683 [Channa argus]
MGGGGGRHALAGWPSAQITTTEITSEIFLISHIISTISGKSLQPQVHIQEKTHLTGSSPSSYSIWTLWCEEKSSEQRIKRSSSVSPIWFHFPFNGLQDPVPGPCSCRAGSGRIATTPLNKTKGIL